MRASSTSSAGRAATSTTSRSPASRPTAPPTSGRSRSRPSTPAASSCPSCSPGRWARPAPQKEMNTWGLDKDEFKDTGNWPHQLYVREARRMLGEFVMTQADIMEHRTKPDSVGLGSYNTDSHHVQRVADKDGNVVNEGDFQVRVQPYAIPYRSLVPKAAQCENLLVPVCMSASHVAYGTVRMEPVYMILGQASGVAAALAIDGKTSVQGVAVDRLVAKLKAQKAVLSPDGLSKSAGAARGLDPA